MTSIKGQLDVDGNVVRYSQSGQGDLVVTLDTGMWDLSPLRDALAARYRVIRLELAGLMDASSGERPKSIERLAGLLTRAAGEIGAEKYSLIGESSAATIAVWQALLTPDSVDALVLLSPVAILPQGDPISAPADQLVARQENAAGLMRLGPSVAEGMISLTGSGAHQAELETRLGEVSCATLAVFGLNDPIVAPEAARVYREQIPNCNVSFVYDAGHAILADRPEALISAVIDFVERRETFIVGRESGLINP